MNRNIEIKARLKNREAVVDLLKQRTKTAGELILQHDVFFKCLDGRLKLRIFNETSGELIFYKRANQDGPKQSQYWISKTEEPLKLRELMKSALGIHGEVKKRRLLFLIAQTRVHIDDVEGLGDYLELEVVLTAGQDTKEGEGIAKDLMNFLKIDATDLVSEAYVDLLAINSPST